MKLGLMYTGGTIGCFYKPLRPMTRDEFKKLFDEHALPVLHEKFPTLVLEYIAFGPTALDSTNLVPTDWCSIVERILPRFCDLDAFIVLHGTDTMAYSASALSFLFTGVDKDGHRNAILNKPIILTGSQLPLFDGEKPSNAEMRFNTDAFQNLCGSVECAYHGVPKVCLFFHHKLYMGTRTLKTSSNQFEAFSSPNYPPLLQVGIDTAINHHMIRPNFRSSSLLLGSSVQARERLQEQLDFMKEHLSSIRLCTFEAYPGNPAQLANQLERLLSLGDANEQAEGLILDSYGAGNMPSGCVEDPTQGKLYQVLHRANQAGVVIVNNTTCLSGMVNSSAYAAGSWLSSREIGAVSAYDMTPVALYTKLLFVLTLARRYSWNDTTIRRALTTNYCLEMVDVHCLDTFGQRELWPGESLTSRDGTARFTNDMAHGPQLVLLDENGTSWNEKNPVWSALDGNNPTALGLSCILRMQTDGNLVMRDSAYQTLWESGTAISLKDNGGEPAFCRLEVAGRTDDRGPSLFIYNYISHKVKKYLYQHPSPGSGKDDAMIEDNNNDSNKRQKTTVS